MAFYKVIVHGTGISVPSDAGSPLIGFYTTRAVRAGSAEEAVVKAKASVAALWSSQEYAEKNAGEPPTLETEAVAEISRWAAFKIPNKGHVFYGVE